MACNSPPSPAVWENNNSSNGNNNSSNHSSGSSNNPNVSNGSVKNSAMLDPTSRGQVPYQPPVDSPPAYMGEYTHQNWYQQQGAHLGLSQSGQVHHAPPTAPSATQSMGAVYWCRKMDNISTGVLSFTWGFFFFFGWFWAVLCAETPDSDHQIRVITAKTRNTCCHTGCKCGLKTSVGLIYPPPPTRWTHNTVGDRGDSNGFFSAETDIYIQYHW